MDEHTGELKLKPAVQEHAGGIRADANTSGVCANFVIVRGERGLHELRESTVELAVTESEHGHPSG
jgi:hypothetical protein